MIFIEYCYIIFLWEKKVKIDSTLLILGMFPPFGELEMRLVWEIINLSFYTFVVEYYNKLL